MYIESLSYACGLHLHHLNLRSVIGQIQKNPRVMVDRVRNCVKHFDPLNENFLKEPKFLLGEARGLKR